MKLIKYFFMFMLAASLFLFGCSNNVDSNSNNDDSSETDLTDTDGNKISSGSASVSFSSSSASGSTTTISAAYLIDGVTVEITSGEYSSASGSSDQVVFLVINGGSLKITGTSDSPVEISKSGSAASGGQVGDDYNFYGINSGIVVSGSASSATIEYATIASSSNGSNAIVSTNGANVTIKNSTITTSGSAGSRGLHCTYDGSISADTVSITTQGASCASLATDRGGGTINASNMTLKTNSAGSPLIYSTGEINVSDSTGSANNAQMIVIEGASSATLDGCDFTCTGKGNRTGTSESNTSSHTVDAGGIMIYQSMSGDSSDGTDYFTASDSTLEVTTSGIPMIYVTNITAEIELSNNTFTQASSSDYFIIAEETDQWGSVGSNGGKVTLTVTSQDLTSYTAFKGGSSSNSLEVSGSSFSKTTSTSW
ncbi:MAG: hypothetical protein K5829_02235 [Treponema sp.]|nr:hypothetical protein [Treponema sp.]